MKTYSYLRRIATTTLILLGFCTAGVQAAETKKPHVPLPIVFTKAEDLPCLVLERDIAIIIGAQPAAVTRMNLVALRKSDRQVVPKALADNGYTRATDLQERAFRVSIKQFGASDLESRVKAVGKDLNVPVTTIIVAKAPKDDGAGKKPPLKSGK